MTNVRIIIVYYLCSLFFFYAKKNLKPFGIEPTSNQQLDTLVLPTVYFIKEQQNSM